MLQHLQRGRTGSLCRLAVIRITLAVARPQAVGINVVPRGAVSRPHLLQKGHSGFLAVGKGELCDKAAFFLFIFAGGCAPDGAVILHVRSSR